MLAKFLPPLRPGTVWIGEKRHGLRLLQRQANFANLAPDTQLEAPEPGTVKEHDHHIFLWTRDWESRAATGEPDWPSKVERQACTMSSTCSIVQLL